MSTNINLNRLPNISISSALLASSALVVGSLGTAHLIFTFHGDHFLPRDSNLQARMLESAPMLTNETSMWHAWVGFNASHSMGAMLFGAVYGYLALAQDDLLFRSPVLLGVGLAQLGGYLFVARRYWFSAPLRGVVLATGLFVGAIGVRYIAAK